MQLANAGRLFSDQTRNVYAASSLAAFAAVTFELLLASYATFLMGASILQYSLALSLMMFGMGLGAFLSDPLRQTPVRSFVFLECVQVCIVLVALPILYYSYATRLGAETFIVLFVSSTGMIIGAQMPLLSEIRSEAKKLGLLLFFDYVGGSLGALLFALLLVPKLGFFRLAGLVALICSTSAVVITLPFYGSHFKKTRWFWVPLLTFALVLSIIFLICSETVREGMEAHFFHIHNPVQP